MKEKKEENYMVLMKWFGSSLPFFIKIHLIFFFSLPPRLQLDLFRTQLHRCRFLHHALSSTCFPPLSLFVLLSTLHGALSLSLHCHFVWPRRPKKAPRLWHLFLWMHMQLPKLHFRIIPTLLKKGPGLGYYLVIWQRFQAKLYCWTMSALPT